MRTTTSTVIARLKDEMGRAPGNRPTWDESALAIVIALEAADTLVRYYGSFEEFGERCDDLPQALVNLERGHR